MEKESNQANPSHIGNTNTKTAKDDQSPRKQEGGGDKLKRDEWSEGAVSCLLESYESKWILRNRAKLKGQDWEDVAHHVSMRMHGTKSSKTQTQCKNKIESMKKRYRSETAASSWPLYSRLHRLLRGTPGHPTPHGHSLHPPAAAAAPLMLMMEQRVQPQQLAAEGAHKSLGSNGVDKVAKEDGVVRTKASDQLCDKIPLDSDSSTPALYNDNDKLRSQKARMKVQTTLKKQREEFQIVESIKWFTEAMAKSEQARMDAMREIEKMRMEAEARRGEMDLKRTEIIANTQLEIAKLFAGINASVDPSLRIVGRK